MGALFGVLGTVITYTMAFKSILFMLTGIVVAIIGIQMLGIIPGLRRLSPKLPSFCSLPAKGRNKVAGRPLIIGLLTGCMPCGSLYAMWIYAMSTCTLAKGALAMFAFALGTTPLMFIFGAINSFSPSKWLKYMIKVSSVFILALGMSTLLKGISMA